MLLRCRVFDLPFERSSAPVSPLAHACTNLCTSATQAPASPPARQPRPSARPRSGAPAPCAGIRPGAGPGKHCLASHGLQQSLATCQAQTSGAGAVLDTEYCRHRAMMVSRPWRVGAVKRQWSAVKRLLNADGGYSMKIFRLQPAHSAAKTAPAQARARRRPAQPQDDRAKGRKRIGIQKGKSSLAEGSAEVRAALGQSNKKYEAGMDIVRQTWV
jgi:hypothetical protein